MNRTPLFRCLTGLTLLLATSITSAAEPTAACPASTPTRFSSK